jgi:asparagine synthase (glutamine-hydrolysing)
MCGIIGTYSPGSGTSEDVLRLMNAEIRHRGPDDDGFYLNGAVGLGMRRLSIIDLPGGHQPITNEDESCWIVFNGEIYNYPELRQELHGSGHVFTTQGDTETILHAYEESGVDCVHRLNGMFAFAIWDGRRRRLFIARDRLGVKPLYYYWDGRNLAFASEIKALLACPWVPREIDEKSLWDYLTFRYVPAPGTIWKGIRKLAPGHRLVLAADTGTLDVERYWDIRYDPDPAPFDAEVDTAAFGELFKDSVRRRLIADVPVGILLSGGLDSSAVAAAVSEVHNSTLSTFSVAFAGGGEFNETAYAREVAGHLGTDHHEVHIDYSDFVDFLPAFVRYTDEPLADPASVPLYFVSKLAAQHVKVVLSGEGADEVLGGYNFTGVVEQWERLKRFQRVPALLRAGMPAFAEAMGRPGMAERLRRGNIPLEEHNRTCRPYMSKLFSSAEKRALWPDAPPVRDSEDLLLEYYERSGTKDPLHQLLYAYCQDWLVEDLLMKADKMTMANSLELRVPFLDYRLVEWLATRPAEVKVGRDGTGVLTTKWLLREFARQRLPQSILHRPKLGFPVPLDQWLKGDLGRLASDLLLAPGSHLSKWFDRAEMQRVLAASSTTLDSDRLHRIWLLLVLELWAQQWL